MVNPLQMPLGAFLSGGVDSSTIVELVQSKSSQRAQTFTIGFDETGFDESLYARAVADHFGTDHHEMWVSSKMARDVIPSLPWMDDEPFADSSQIPTHLVCKAARQHVTVLVGGDGGDELSGGDNRYFSGSRIWSKLSWMPLSARQLMAGSICAVPVNRWDYVSRATSTRGLAAEFTSWARGLPPSKAWTTSTGAWSRNGTPCQW